MARCAICESLLWLRLWLCHPQIFDFSPTINKTINQQLLLVDVVVVFTWPETNAKQRRAAKKSKHCIFNKFLVCFNNIWDLYRVSKSNPHTHSAIVGVLLHLHASGWNQQPTNIATTWPRNACHAWLKMVKMTNVSQRPKKCSRKRQKSSIS